MKELSTFFQICIYITVAMVLFTLSISFVSALGVFQTTVETGFVPGDTTNETFSDLTNLETSSGLTGMNAILAIVTGSIIGLVGGMALGWIMQSTVFIGIGVFTGVFWTSYISALSIVNTNNWLMAFPMNLFVGMGTVGMLFIFGAAITGMLSGSG